MRAIGIRTAVAVRFQTAVLRPDGTTRNRSRWQKNLILDQGLDRAAVDQWCDLFKVAAIGTGELTVRRNSESINLSRSGNTVLASSAFFEASDVGRLIKFDSEEEMYVTGFTDSTHVSVGVSGTIAAGPGTIWYVNSTGLVAETKRTQSYSPAEGANNTIVTVDTLLFKRTFVFTPEVSTVTYTEVGWAWTTTPGAGNMFGMAPLLESTQTLESGEQFQVTIQMSLVITPTTLTAIADSSGGLWNTAGTLMIESLGDAVSRVSTTGTTTPGTALEPSAAMTFRAIRATWSQSTSMITSALTWAVSTATVAMTLDAYVAGTFERTMVGTFAINAANGLVYGFGFDGGNRTISIKFTTPQTKSAQNQLTTVFKRTWQRALNNVVE